MTDLNYLRFSCRICTLHCSGCCLKATLKEQNVFSSMHLPLCWYLCKINLDPLKGYETMAASKKLLVFLWNWDSSVCISVKLFLIQIPQGHRILYSWGGVNIFASTCGTWTFFQIWGPRKRNLLIGRRNISQVNWLVDYFLNRAYPLNRVSSQFLGIWLVQVDRSGW